MRSQKPSPPRRSSPGRAEAVLEAARIAIRPSSSSLAPSPPDLRSRGRRKPSRTPCAGPPSEAPADAGRGPPRPRGIREEEGSRALRSARRFAFVGRREPGLRVPLPPRDPRADGSGLGVSAPEARKLLSLLASLASLASALMGLF